VLTYLQCNGHDAVQTGPQTAPVCHNGTIHLWDQLHSSQSSSTCHGIIASHCNSAFGFSLLFHATKYWLHVMTYCTTAGYDDRGFVFYTNYNSRKGTELVQSGKAALAFFWEGLQRQVSMVKRSGCHLSILLLDLQCVHPAVHD
jgi:hypothetical protein